MRHVYRVALTYSRHFDDALAAIVGVVCCFRAILIDAIAQHTDLTSDSCFELLSSELASWATRLYFRASFKASD